MSSAPSSSSGGDVHSICVLCSRGTPTHPTPTPADRCSPPFCSDTHPTHIAPALGKEGECFIEDIHVCAHCCAYTTQRKFSIELHTRRSTSQHSLHKISLNRTVYLPPRHPPPQSLYIVPSLYCPQDRGCGHVPNALRANRAYATRLSQRHRTIIPP